MLAISRRRDESVIIRDPHGTEITVRVLEIKEDSYGRRVILGLTAPREWPICREELQAECDALANLRATFEDAPDSVQRQFLAEMGVHMAAKNACEMLNSLVRKMEKMGLLHVEHRSDGATVFASGPLKTQPMHTTVPAAAPPEAATSAA
jgi:sRNA-binding carbon storage regulator CsrA